jgi:hypothetical protein
MDTRCSPVLWIIGGCPYSPYSHDLGGNVVEKVVLPDGAGRLAGGSAEQPEDSFNRQSKARRDFAGLRAIRE